MRKSLFLITVLIAWLVVSCESSSSGPQGETGPTGDHGPAGVGETGIQGSTGEGAIGPSGENGHDGICWDNIKPEIIGVTYNSSMYIGGGPYIITIHFNGSTHSIEELEFGLMAIYGTVTQNPFPNHNQFIFTPVQSGGPLTFTALASDTCQQDFLTFPIDFIYPAGDIDGNFYHAVTIGTQVWLAENLKVIHYNNGSAIPNVTNGSDWQNLTTEAYCNYGNSEINGSIYGRLYNWFAVNTGILCPIGWHVPSNDEWKALSTLLGANNGGKMKEAGTDHWANPNEGATNESGFSGLPGGYRNIDFDGSFIDLGETGYWWSATEHLSSFAWVLYLSYISVNVTREPFDKKLGLSIRCVKD